MPRERRAPRVIRALAGVALACGVVVACGEERPYPASFAFTANPLPPAPGQPVQLAFSGENIGLVEVFQGSELVTTIVNPAVELSEVHVFTARSAAIPRAIAWGVNGARFEVEATRGGQAPQVKPEAGPDGAVIPPEACGAAADIGTAPDAGPAFCALPGTFLMTLRVVNARATDLWVYRDDARPGAPPACSFPPHAVIAPGGIEITNLYENGVLRFVESSTSAIVRQVRVASTDASCVIVVK